MTELTQSFYDLVTTDGLCGALLPLYRGRQAMFTGSLVPGDAPFPRVLSIGNDPFDQISNDPLAGVARRRDLSVSDDIRVSPVRLELLSNRVTELFTWGVLTTKGFEGLTAKATEGEDDPRDSRFDFRVRRIRVRLFESGVSSSPVGFEDREIPTETPNGTITNFSTTRVFTAGSLRVWLNATQEIFSFTVDSDRQGYNITPPVRSGDKLHHSYRF